MAIKAVQNFSGELPAVPVYKNGIVHFCHNQKELDKWTKDESDGGMGYSQDYQHQEYPKLMSHPGRSDVKVANAKEQAEREAEGYSFDHWENAQAKASAATTGAAPSFDPKAQARMDELERQNRELTAKMDLLLNSLGVGKAAKEPKGSKPTKETEASEI